MPLPSLPANLDTTCLSCGEISALTAQLTAGVAGQVAGGIAAAQGAVTGQLAQVQALVAQANAASAAAQAIIDAALSDEIIDQLLAQFTVPPLGIPDIQCVKDELLRIHDQLNTANEVVIKTLQGPPIDIGAAIEALIPPIPLPVIPSPGEIKERILAKLEEKRKQLEEEKSKLQNAKAKALENAPTFV